MRHATRATLLTSALLLAPLCHADTLKVDAQYTFAPMSGAFSLLWDSEARVVVPGSLKYSFAGQRSDFSLLDCESIQYGGLTFPYVAFRDSIGDLFELDLLDHEGENFPHLGAYGMTNLQLWGRGLDMFPVNASLNVTQTPEPGTFALVTMSIFVLWLFTLNLWRKRA